MMHLVSCLLTIALANQGASPIPPSAKKAAELYVKAFAEAQFTALEHATTVTFVESNGGEKQFKKVLASTQAKYRGARADGLQFELLSNSQTTAHLRFKIKLRNGKSEKLPWFLAKRTKSGEWLIDSILHDFEPGSGP